jgi:hypothetical protein
MAQLEDGSFVFASTESLLWRALIQLDLAPTWMYTADELEYFTIRYGVMLSKEMLPAPKDTATRWDYNYYRHQTSGAKGSGYTSTTNYVPGYGWDDEWSEDDIAEINSWNDSFDMPQYKPTLNNVFWTQIKEELSLYPDTLFYTEDERDLWVNELYMMADDPSLELLDYGEVLPDGELVSAMNDDSQLF